MAAPENYFSLCKMHIHLPNVTLPDNPVSTSKDLAPPELHPDVSLLTEDVAIPLLGCKCFSPPHQTFVGYSTWDVGYLGCCDGVTGLDEDICSSNAIRSLNYLEIGDILQYFAIIRIMLKGNNQYS